MAPPTLTPARLRALRTRAQWLTGRPGTSAAAVAAHMVGLQAQDERMSRLLVRPRGSGLTGAATDAAARDDALVRTWAMRGTLHLLAAADVRWLVGLLGPVFAAAGRRRRRELGLTDELCERAFGAIPEILSGREFPRGRLVRELAAAGVPVDPDGQAPAHLVAYAAQRGLVCRGPDSAGRPTYALLDDRVPPAPPLDHDAALAALARRYVAGYGPAGAADLAAWSGLPASRARHAFALVAGEFTEARAGSEPVWLAPGTPFDEPGGEPGGPVRLLGHFDGYLLGYRDRTFALDPRYARRVQRGGGFVLPVLLVDGRVAGTWRRESAGGRLAVTVEPFAALSRAALAGVAAEATDLGRYLDVDATYEVAPVPGDG